MHPDRLGDHGIGLGARQVGPVTEDLEAVAVLGPLQTLSYTLESTKRLIDSMD